MACVPEHVRMTHSRDGAVVLDVKLGRMFTLNLVGSRILDLLDRQYTTAQIAAELSREFQIDSEVAVHDVEGFLETLERQRLLETHPLAAGL